MSQTTLSPDEAAAHMYPSDLKKFEFGEHVADAFSIAVGCPNEVSVPLFTTTQAEAYANARVREALEEAISAVESCRTSGTIRHGTVNDCIEAIRALLPHPTTAAERSQWQPMETAPAEGRSVLLFAGLYRDGHEYAPTIVVGWHLDKEGWIASSYGGSPIAHLRPKAWMPLPAFPSTPARPESEQ